MGNLKDRCGCNRILCTAVRKRVKGRTVRHEERKRERRALEAFHVCLQVPRTLSHTGGQGCVTESFAWQWRQSHLLYAQVQVRVSQVKAPSPSDTM